LKVFIRFFLITFLLSSYGFSAQSKYIQNKFNETKKLYLSAIMSSNKTKEIEYLKKLIRYGDKLGIDTVKYQRELNKIDKSTIIKKNIVQTKSVLPKPVQKKRETYSKPKENTNREKISLKDLFNLKPKNKSKKYYSIKSVEQDKNTITIRFKKKINSKYLDFVETKDKRNYYDDFYIKGSFKDAKPTKLSIFGVDRIIVSQFRKEILKISLRNRTNLNTIYILNKDSIVIKVLESQKAKKIYAKNKSKKSVELLPSDIFYPSKKTIVIDAGHGGKDSGAVGRGRNYEKNVVLRISKYLKNELEKEGFTVYLTRTRDKFVKLDRRTKYANKKNADMFISLHANAAKKSRARKAHGVETYFLSPARSKRAKRVAALENKGDMRKMGWGSKSSFLTVLNQAKITASNKMAIDIQRNMLYTLRGKYGKKAIRDGGVREGPFWVLVGAQMPSVLVEVGYISHPQEGSRIATKRYQKLVASGIAQGVKSYFIKN
jgi:N-acetylmuramoyl-L-alanine amidase